MKKDQVQLHYFNEQNAIGFGYAFKGYDICQRQNLPYLCTCVLQWIFQCTVDLKKRIYILELWKNPHECLMTLEGIWGIII